jgi:hypothetical protein
VFKIIPLIDVRLYSTCALNMRKCVALYSIPPYKRWGSVAELSCHLAGSIPYGIRFSHKSYPKDVTLKDPPLTRQLCQSSADEEPRNEHYQGWHGAAQAERGFLGPLIGGFILYMAYQPPSSIIPHTSVQEAYSILPYRRFPYKRKILLSDILGRRRPVGSVRESYPIRSGTR